MKYVILVGDGMGDYPVEELGGMTPLQAAATPFMRRIAAAGMRRMLVTVTEGLPPGSDVCNLGLLGYNAAEQYTGRAPIEAAGAGIPMKPDDIAVRCNLVTVENGRMADYSAGHITTEEARELIESVQEKLGARDRVFHAGVSYRHLIIWNRGPESVTTRPPHDITGQPIAEHLPSGKRSDEVRELMEASKSILADHPVNRARIRDGKKPATQIWLWGQGRAMSLQSYAERYGLRGGVITAVDLIRGIGVLAGLSTPDVPGATGFIDTNYEGKVAAALRILEQDDFVYVHIEAPDECGHMGDAKLKTRAIEAFDKRVVGPIWQALEEKGEAYRLVVTMDHRTPIRVRSHTVEPIPAALLEGPVGLTREEASFDEFIDDPAPVRSYEFIHRVLTAQKL